MATPLSDPQPWVVYAELLAWSNFSFHQGASHPEELVAKAHALGYEALALTDDCSVAGVVRAHTEARQRGLRLLPGASFALTDAATLPGWHMVVLPHNLEGWGNLCQYITASRLAVAKGSYLARLPPAASGALDHCEIILLPPRQSPRSRQKDHEFSIAITSYLTSAIGIFRSKNTGLWLGASLHQSLDDDWWLMQLHQWHERTGLPLVATGGVAMHVRSRKPLLDVLTATRLGQAVADCGSALRPNGQAHLRSRLTLARLYPPALLNATLTLAQRCRFDLGELRYRYPTETVGPGETPAQTLARLTWAGAHRRYGAAAVPEAVAQQLAHELALIAELGYEMYFLTVHDLVRFARERDILCQGRGSAANSAVCYCLGVTEVDPAQSTLLFERFISRERNEPPDIDVDFEHQRREEVIQYIYAKYGRGRAALTATVVSYRPRSALRDVGRALGVNEALIRALATEHPGMYGRQLLPQRLAEALARLPADTPVPDARTLDLWLALSQQLMGFPRHLSQHVGGFVLTDGPLTRLVPVEPTAMAGRSIIQWDKDDLDAMGLLKVDVLALGMLSALRRALDLLALKPVAPHGPGQLALGSAHARSDAGRLTLAAIPKDDPATYDMASRADTVGVFQIESRAQMSMLPRLRPQTFYDLVIQVAIVRPGPIQGGMVHPYLQRRHGFEAIHYPHRDLETALGRTLGVPIFQEQVMQVAMLCAGFSAGEADSLRRAMAAWKRKGGVQHFHDRVMAGMLARGYTAAFAEQIFSQMEGFGEYGFPESHAASFALLVYVSAWIKCHHPDVFLTALLNSQPMGFYPPSQLVQDAQRHGVVVLPVDALASDVDSTLEASPNVRQPVRLGLHLVSGLGTAAAQRLVNARQRLALAGRRLTSVAEMAHLAQLSPTDLDALAAADALQTLAGHRRQQTWAAAGAQPGVGLFDSENAPNDALPPTLLTPPTLAQEVVCDHAATGLSLKAHPVGLLRARLGAMRLQTAAELAHAPSGRLARACGIVTVRQQPGTAKGVMFVTLEDETGSVNVVVWQRVKDAQRSEWLHARLLAVYGVWQRDDDTGGQVRHLVAKRLKDLTPLLGELGTRSRDFR
ncbi:MAG: error-prone DNA polymerase [Polaromonas sp.]|nr:error-prone DNA polymerase [Polaromonas sp.]